MKSLRILASRIGLLHKIGFSNKVNFCLNVIESKLKRTRLFSHPVVLDIVPTKLCNLNCIFCIQYDTEGAKSLARDDFDRIAKTLFPYAWYVNFCSGGEPFLNRDFLYFLDTCRKYKVLISIVSNGMLLTEEITRTLVLNDYLEVFSFSFDGARSQTVESIRRGVKFQKVVDNMRLMADMKRRYRRNFPTLQIRCAVMKRNIEELPDVIRSARVWGINRVVVNFLNVANDIDKNESLFYHPDLTRRVFSEASRIASSEHVGLELPELPTGETIERPCYFPWRFFKIDPEGSAKFCYKAWNNPIGNFFKTDRFFDLWNSEHYQLIRKTVNGPKPYFRYCSICSVRRGSGAENAHIQYLDDSLYDFDRDYRASLHSEIPERVITHARNERGIQKNTEAPGRL